MTLFGNVEDRTLSVLDHQETRRQPGPGPRQSVWPGNQSPNEHAFKQIFDPTNYRGICTTIRLSCNCQSALRLTTLRTHNC